MEIPIVSSRLGISSCLAVSSFLLPSRAISVFNSSISLIAALFRGMRTFSPMVFLTLQRFAERQIADSLLEILALSREGRSTPDSNFCA